MRELQDSGGGVMIVARIGVSFVVLLVLAYMLLTLDLLPWWAEDFLLVWANILAFLVKWCVCLALALALIAIWVLPEGVL